ncbi:MAG TPA: STAS domain-containing protein [Spirochaetota bacterium]|nr:STAS domain-containing protein [Spirochaetota bacterium]HPL18342.1 STAS domain-containing protein [Spirochaetota bacterium]HQF07870.1 STAS domain-containing protein [Spirochaetota bacterium]HQH96429.1 STAS domain-containing protein [Spirochaetota bacterium]HQJ69602.1 STAS domain-containing protein [Spirochaetota bacterium]
MVLITVEDHGKVVIVNIDGEFYIDSVENAEKIWNEQLARHPKVMAVNCKNIKYIDSSAIGILVKFLNSAMKQKTEMIFYDLNENILGVFKTAKLNNFFKIMTRTQFEMEYLEK